MLARFAAPVPETNYHHLGCDIARAYQTSPLRSTCAQSMLPRVYSKSKDCRLAECFGRFQAVQAFNKDEAGTVRANHNRARLPAHKHALRNGADARFVERGATLSGHVDIVDRKALPLQHAFRSSFTPPLHGEAAGSVNAPGTCIRFIRATASRTHAVSNLCFVEIGRIARHHLDGGAVRVHRKEYQRRYPAINRKRQSLYELFIGHHFVIARREPPVDTFKCKRMLKRQRSSLRARFRHERP